MTEPTQLHTMVMRANRKFPMSTDICIYLTEPWLECYIALGNPLDEDGAGECIGYLHCKAVECELLPAADKATEPKLYAFAVVDLLAGSSPVPPRLIALSGSVWSLSASIVALQTISSYQQGLDQQVSQSSTSAHEAGNLVGACHLNVEAGVTYD